MVIAAPFAEFFVYKELVVPGDIDATFENIRAGYIHRIPGNLLMLAGVSWVIYELGPFLLPAADLGFVMIASLGEVIFMLWLLARGWKIRQQD